MHDEATWRRRRKWERELYRARDRLAEIEAAGPDRYGRRQDYQRVVTLWRHKVRRLEKMLRGDL